MMKTIALLLLFINFWTSTGNQFPDSGINDADVGVTAWTNPGNVTADDAADATCNAASSSNHLRVTDFDFVITDGSTINGVFVRVEASEHSGGTEPLLAQLYNGTGIGNEKSAANEGNISGTTKAVYTYGSTSDLWGATLTEAIVEGINFGVMFRFNTSHDVRIDFVTMAVEYTTPAGHRVLIISKGKTYSTDAIISKTKNKKYEDFNFSAGRYTAGRMLRENKYTEAERQYNNLGFGIYRD